MAVSLLFLLNSIVQAAPVDSDIAQSTASGGLAGASSAIFMLFLFIPILFSGLFYLFTVLASSALLVLWILMLIDVIQRDEKDFHSESKDQKIIWLLVILLTSYIGACIYYFMVYKKFGRAIKK